MLLKLKHSWAIWNHRQIVKCCNYTRIFILFWIRIELTLFTLENSRPRWNHRLVRKSSYFIRPTQKKRFPKKYAAWQFWAHMYLPEGGSATIVALAAVLRVLERKRFGGPKVAQMHPDNIRQRPGSVRAISAQHPGNIAAAVSASPPPFVLPPMFFSITGT